MRIGLARGLLALLLLLPGISHALGLGDVHLNSPLNAPLDAEIELVNATPEDLATLDAKLASKETFARYGLDWPPFMSSVTVTRDRSASGAQVLRIKSTETVTEPFLTLLIEATWARGRLVREYTVLLDPPVFAPNSVAAAPRAGACGGCAARPPARSPVPRPRPNRRRPMPQSPAGGGDSYEVQRGDSLSAIARRLSASTGARTDQLMVSIYRGNSARVRRRHESPARRRGAAHSERRRNRRRVAVRGERRSPPPARARGPPRAAAGVPAACAWCRRATRPRAPGSGTGNSAEVDALQNRVRELEGQLNESKRMLELRNTELADLQAKLAASQQQPARAARAARRRSNSRCRTPEAVTPRRPKRPRPKPPRHAGSRADPDAEPPAAERRPAEQQPVGHRADRRGRAVAARHAARATGGSLGALAAADPRRCCSPSRAASARSPSSTTAWAAWPSRAKTAWPQPMDSLSDTGRMRAPNDGLAIPDDILVEESGTHRALQETQDIPLAPTVRTDETISSETAINLDQGDPLAEADFHMAYGLYDQAADLVRIAIQREPASSRPQAQAPRSVLRLGQQRAVPHDGARAGRYARRRPKRASGKRSSSWASRSRPKIRCSPMAARRQRGGRRPESRCRRFRPRRFRSVRRQLAPGCHRRRQRRPGRPRSRQRAARSGCHGRRPRAARPRQQWPDHARDDRQDDAGRIGSARRSNSPRCVRSTSRRFARRSKAPCAAS